MAFIISNFGSFSAYATWCGGKTYNYHVKLTNTTTLETEILKNNPIGITKIGQQYERHEIYEGFFPNMTLKLDFVNRENYGGDFIKSDYDLRGVRGTINFDLYKKNTLTNDYDINYQGKIDFSEGSYNHDLNLDIISVNLIEQGKVNKLLSRDELNVNLRGGKSIEGVTIANFTNENRTIKYDPIDIAMVVDMSGAMSGDNTIVGNGTEEYYDGFRASTITSNQIGGRLVSNLETAEQEIYSNDSGEARRVTIVIEGTYDVNLDIHGLNATNDCNITIYSKFKRGAILTTIYSENIIRTNIPTIGTEHVQYTGIINQSFDYLIENGGTFEGYMRINCTSSNMAINYYADLYITNFYLIEYSDGEPQTSCRTYLMHEALTRLDQILTDETDVSKLIYSTVFGRTNSEIRTYASNGTGAFRGLINGWQARKILDKSFVLNFRDLFKTLKNTDNVGMGYDTINQRFYIEDLATFYKSTITLDFGLVDKLTKKPDRHPNKIMSGYNYSGNYDNFSGANEPNLKSEYSFTFETKNTLDCICPLRGDSLGIELARRKSNYLAINEDTESDSAIFIVVTDSIAGNVVQGAKFSGGLMDAASGFPCAEQYYNYAISPRENLLRIIKRLKGFVWKTDEDLVFLNNTKDINPHYTSRMIGTEVNEQDNIDFSAISRNPYNNPEIYEIETKITDLQLNTILSDIHGQFKCADKYGNVYYFHMMKLDMSDFEKGVKITGKNAYRP